MGLPEIETASRELLSLLLGTLIRSSFLAGGCGIAAWFLRFKPAEIRHLLWHGMLISLLLLPAFEITVPPLRQASQTLTSMQAMVFQSASPIGTIAPQQAMREPATPVRQAKGGKLPAWPVLPAFLYVLVALALLIRLVLSLYHLKQIVRRSRFIPGFHLRELAHDVWLQSGAFTRPRVRVSSDVVVPVAMEAEEVVILLPESWEQWDEDKLRVVLMHEMSHVRRDDPATAALASLATCLYWFHPLAWFLRRQLAALAENACDEFTLETVSTPEQYARIVLDFASDVAGQRSRVLEPASAVVRDSQIKKRLERIFAVSDFTLKGLAIIRVLLLAALIPAVYFAAAARMSRVQQQENAPAALEPGSPSTPEQAVQIESKLQANPDDMEARARLLNYYRWQGQGADFVRQLLWIIQNHPESQLAGAELVSATGDTFVTVVDYEQLKTAWEEALTKYPNSSDVLVHAARFFAQGDPERALQLIERGKELDSSHDPHRHQWYVSEKASIYVAAVMINAAGFKSNRATAVIDSGSGDARFGNHRVDMPPAVAANLRNSLENSTDPELLSATGTILARWEMAGTSNQGFQLLQKAIDLDPANPRWKEALESAKVEPIREQNARQAVAMPRPGPGAVRIGQAIAEANLLTKVDPEYPPLALSARIQGDVELTIAIGPDGHAKNIRLVRGHPLLVNAAVAALTHWVYRPTLLNGKAVTVITTVSVPFRLPY